MFYQTSYTDILCFIRRVTRIYYVLSDELHGYIFRPLHCHFQAITVHRAKNYNCKFVFVWLDWAVSSLVLKYTCQNSFLYPWIEISIQPYQNEFPNVILYLFTSVA